jgi:MFS family permease
MWNANERGKSLAIYGIACWLGPFVAPIFGAYVAEYLTWRWVFWTISILCGCIQVLAIFFLKEAYEPVLLERKAQRIRKERSLKSNTGIIPGRMGKREEGPTMVRTEHHIDNRLKHLMKTRLSLTVIMMFTHPAVFLPSLYRAYLYGLMYLAISTFPLVWENIYHQSTTDASLNYLPGMVGMLVSLYVTSSFIDGVRVPLLVQLMFISMHPVLTANPVPRA